MDVLWQDIRYSFRLFAKDPRFTIVVVIMLALGLGVNTAIFSVVNALLLRPLPVKDPAELVVLATKFQRSDFPNYLSYPDYRDYHEQSTQFSDLAAYMNRDVNFSTETEAQRMHLEVVTSNYFSMLGVEPLLGRTFQEEANEAMGSSPYLVLSHSFWQRRFNGDSSMVGKTIRINGSPFTIIGVMPEEFPGTEWLLKVDAYVPLVMIDQVWPGHPGLDQRAVRIFRVMGRLKPGVTINQIKPSLSAIAAQLEKDYPTTNKGAASLILPEASTRPEISMASFIPSAALVFMILVGLILLIACINIANLLLARALNRQKEMAMRVALGASRSRIIRQLLTETVLLSLVGGAVGTLLAIWLTRLFSSLRLPTDAPIKFDLTPDWRVFAFAFILALIAGVLSGLVPAYQTSKPNLNDTLKEGSKGLVSRSRRYISSILVVSQIALSLLLLICAGLFVRSLQKAEKIELGFRSQNLLLLSLDIGLQGYSKPQGEQFYRQMLDRVEALPGVNSASIAYLYPFSTRGNTAMDVFKDNVADPEAERLRVFYNFVGTNYFQTAGTPLIKGREFTQEDSASATKTIIVNETLAQRMWPGEDPIGKQLKLRDPENPIVQVIGVAKDGKYIMPVENRRSYMYMPISQNYQPAFTLYVHSSSDPGTLINAIRQEIRGIDRNLPVYDVVSMEEHLRSGIAFMPLRLGAMFVGAFGLLGLFMATVGVYGLVAYSMSQRTREIGIRVALGATPGHIFKLIAWQGLRLTLIGIVIGVGFALATTQLLGSLVYGVGALDPVSFLGATFILAGISILACALPARRATKADPINALRSE
ncbi:MAG: ABC transporter permease [Blastocatellia bacterium]